MNTSMRRFRKGRSQSGRYKTAPVGAVKGSGPWDSLLCVLGVSVVPSQLRTSLMPVRLRFVGMGHAINDLFLEGLCRDLQSYRQPHR